jgi:spore germination cell wall hydrolase CwlJ-like protein
MFVTALSIILSMVSAIEGASWSGHDRIMRVQHEIVKYISGPAVQISINAPPRDLALSRLMAEYECLAQVMYYEARSEGATGELAVAEVVFHRIRSGVHGRSICAVVYEGANTTACQFSFVCDGSLDKPREMPAWRSAESLAAQMLAGSLTLPDMTDGATNYHADYVRPVWSGALIRTAQVGHHIFYRQPGGENLVLAEQSFRGPQW